MHFLQRVLFNLDLISLMDELSRTQICIVIYVRSRTNDRILLTPKLYPINTFVAVVMY